MSTNETPWYETLPELDANVAKISTDGARRTGSNTIEVWLTSGHVFNFTNEGFAELLNRHVYPLTAEAMQRAGNLFLAFKK